jgi:hypothetical protein
MNSTPNLAVSNSANYLLDIDSVASTGYFISTVKTSQFLSIASILVGLSMAPLSCTNRDKFELITSIIQGVMIYLRRKTQGTGL